MSYFSFTMVDEGGGYKDARTYELSTEDMTRIVWAYDKCFACDGDQKAIFTAMAQALMATLVDHTHQYELTKPRNPIVPKPE